MTAYLIRRLLTLVPVLAVVVTVVFLLIHLIPGDPVSVMLGPDATPAQIQATRQALGLDRPLHDARQPLAELEGVFDVVAEEPEPCLLQHGPDIGMRAAGRMGGGRVTIRNLKVVRVDVENHLLIVQGGIPGAPAGYVIVRKAIAAKKIKVAQVEKPKKGKK